MSLHMEEEVLFDVKSGVGTITLNRPSTLNALTMRMINQMRFSSLDIKQRIRVGENYKPPQK